MTKPDFQIIGYRNPIIVITYNSVVFRIQVIGDPHLGKHFRNNVPRDRLGRLEEEMFSTFNSLLNTPCVDMYVIVGDLFDKAKVTNEDYKRTIDIIESACTTNTMSKYYILSGNHDLSKDKNKISSFSLLEEYFNTADYINISIISKFSKPLILDHIKSVFYFSHYNPFMSLDDEINNNYLSIDSDKLSISFGHWDTVDYGSDKYIDRYLPKIVRDNFDIIITGHEHKPIRKTVEGKHLAVVGSMRPYAFGEEIEEDGDLYVSEYPNSVVQKLTEDSEYYKNKCVRIIYKDGDILPDNFECSMLVYKYLPSTKAKEEYKPEQDVLSFQNMLLDSLDQLSTDKNKHIVSKIKDCFLERDYESY